MEDQKHNDNGNDDFDCFVLLEITHAEQCHDNHAVTEDHDDQRQKKSNNHLGNLESSTKALEFSNENDTSFLIINRFDTTVDQLRDRQEESTNPNASTGEFTDQHCLGPVTVGRGGQNNNKVSFNAHGHKYEHPTKEAHFVEAVYDFAHVVAKNPGLDNACCPERQSEEEDHVR